MTVVFTDAEVDAFVHESKQFVHPHATTELRRKRGHGEAQIELLGVSGTAFRAILRQSSYNNLNFSIILTTDVPASNRQFRLCRFNGRSHEHKNSIEQNVFYDFHIHRATERYQLLGGDEDGFAEVTAAYASFETAWQEFCSEVCLTLPSGYQFPLF